MSLVTALRRSANPSKSNSYRSPKRLRRRPNHVLAVEHLENRMLLATITPHGQFLTWPNGSSFQHFNLNEAVTIGAARITHLSPIDCGVGHGVGDFFSAATDIYIVDSTTIGGTLTPGGALVDKAGAPNTVLGVGVGSPIFDETIGFTFYDGNIPQGVYGIVFDECQDGTLDAHDGVFDPAFQVVVGNVKFSPAFLYPSSITAFKDKARLEAEKWRAFLPEYVRHMFILDASQALLGLVSAGPHLAFMANTIAAAQIGINPRSVAITQIIAKLQHYRALHLDPPDADFQHMSALSADSFESDSDDPLVSAAFEIGRASATESALAQALLASLERSQGAAEAGDGEWVLTHARDIQAHAAALSDQLLVTDAALSSFRAALSADTRDLDGLATTVESHRSRIATSGLTYDERRRFRNLGMPDGEIDDLQQDIADLDVAFSKAVTLGLVSDLIATNTAMRSDLQTFAADLNDVISHLEADVLRVPNQAPIARAGGPYVAIEGTSVSLNGTASHDPNGNIVAYDWDLDLDGNFNDATGASPVVSFDQAFDGLVGLRVTDDQGKGHTGYARITVTDINRPPSIDTFAPHVLPLDTQLGDSVDFSLDASDPDGDLVSVQWTLDDQPVANGPTFDYQPLNTGEIGHHIVRAVVSDDSPLSGSVTRAWGVNVFSPTDADNDGWTANVDCDDADDAIHPGATELVGNGIDDDCNSQTADIGHLDLTPTAIDASGVTADEQTLVATGTVSVTIKNRGLSQLQNSLAGSFNAVLFEDRNGNATFDPGSDNLLGKQTFFGDIPTGGQVTLDIDVAGIVLFRDNVIYSMVDSADSIFEADETNNVIHSGINSTYQPPVADWQPLVQWQWDDANTSIGVLSTPVVAPLVDTNGDGLINQRDVPAVIVATTGNPNASQVNELVALRGDTGQVIFQVPHPVGPTGIWSSSGETPAVGDIDGDGVPEILIAGFFRNPLFAFNNDGTLKWELDNRNALDAGTVGPLLADLDGDGMSEILYGKAAVNADGTLRWIREAIGGPPTEAPGGSPQIADLDLDGTPEIVAGPTIFNGDGQRVWSWRSVLPPGEMEYSAQLSIGNGPYVEQFRSNSGLGESWTAVANLDGDLEPEIIAISEVHNSMWIFEHDGQIHAGPFNLYTDAVNQITFNLGAPTVADFDGDGQVEIAVATTANLASPTANDPDRVIMNVYEADGSPLWQKDLVFEHTGNFAPPSSAFDFDGDGIFELVVLDPQKLYVLNGPDGTTLFEMGVDRNNALPDGYATIADVDNDGNAEIIVPTKTSLGAGAPPRKGVLVLGDAKDNWVHSRRIWNEWQYEVTNVNEDANIPATARNSWQENNSQRGQVPIEGLDPLAAPDLSVSRVTINALNCPAGAGITARIGNGGSIHVAAGMDVNFYLGDPDSGGTLIGTVPTSGALYPGDFEDVTLDWNSPIAGQIHVTVNETPIGPLTAAPNLSLLPHTWAQGSGLGAGVLIQSNFRTFRGIDGNSSTGWNDNVSGNFDPHHYYEVHFPFPVNATSVTIENQFANAGFLDGTLEFSNGFSMPVTLDANGEGTIAFPQQSDITWIRLTGTTTKANGAGLSEFIVAGSYVQQQFLLNEGAGLLGNNVAASGFNVSPCDPAANLTPVVHAGLDLTINEGDTFALPPASFTDGGVVGLHTAQIDWGDGSTAEAGSVSENGGSGTVDGLHTFDQDGSYPVIVSVKDEVAQTGSDSLTLTVLNVAPEVDAGLDQAADEGTQVSLLATFSDAGVRDTHTATVDWGDGTVDAVNVSESAGAGTATSSHVFGDDGLYTVTVCVSDDEGDTGCDSFDVTVANVAAIVDAGVNQSADEGDTVRLSGASFVDAGTLDTHTVLINWGDTPLTRFGTVTSGSGSSTIDASYEYEDSGTFTVTVCVTDDDQAEACDSFDVVVGNVAPSVTAGFDVGLGNTLSLLPAFFGDPGLADTHTATINWGDGTVEAGDLFQWRGSGSVSATHTYAADGNYTVQVTVTDDEGATGIGSFNVTAAVTNQPPTVQQDTSTQFTVGEAATHAFALTDPNPDDVHTATIDWGDGSPQEAVDLKNNLQGYGVAFPSHAYAAPGTFDIVACATDNRGLSGCNTITVVVSGAVSQLVLTLDDPTTNGVDVIVVDGAPSGTPTIQGPSTHADDLGGTGLIIFQGSVGAFPVNIATVIGESLLGNPAAARLVVNWTGVSSEPGTIVIQASQTGLHLNNQPGTHVLESPIGGVTDGQVSFLEEVDLANNLFATSSTNSTLYTPGLQGPFTSGAFSDMRTVSFSTSNQDPFSITKSVTVIHSGAGQTTGFGAGGQVIDVPASTIVLARLYRRQRDLLASVRSALLDAPRRVLKRPNPQAGTPEIDPAPRCTSRPAASKHLPMTELITRQFREDRSCTQIPLLVDQALERIVEELASDICHARLLGHLQLNSF